MTATLTISLKKQVYVLPETVVARSPGLLPGIWQPTILDVFLL